MNSTADEAAAGSGGADEVEADTDVPPFLDHATAYQGTQERPIVRNGAQTIAASGNWGRTLLLTARREASQPTVRIADTARRRSPRQGRRQATSITERTARMRRLAQLLAATGLGTGLMVGFSAQPAAAEAQCQTALGATHSHWHAAHGHWHTWKTVDVDWFPDRVIVTQYMSAENRSDTANCAR